MNSKFSIVVPIYNVEKYLDFCLKSIKGQTFKDFEVIMVDDGSTDNSSNIAKKYVNKQFKYYHKKNGGLSSARNYGVEKATGKYIMFVDSDDYISSNTLEKVNGHIDKFHDLDIIRYELCTVDENHNIIEKYECFPFSNKTIEYAFPLLLKNNFVEPAPLYIINRKFYLDNKFSFPEKKLHEDFGLIPLILISAKKISTIDFCGYYYVQRDGSIINNLNYNHTVRKVYDTLYHFDMLYKNSRKIKNISQNTLKIFDSYISNAVISKIKLLNKHDRVEFVENLNKRKVIDLLLDNTIKRKIKKILYKINLNFSKWI